MNNTLKVKNRKNRVQDKSLTVIRNVVRIFLIIWAVLIIFPLLWALMSSLKTNGEFALNAWTMPAKLQWVNYKNAWEGANFSKYFLNSLLLSAGTVVLSIVMTTTSAYVVAKFVHPAIHDGAAGSSFDSAFADVQKNESHERRGRFIDSYGY